MSLKFLASQTPAAKSPKLRIKFLEKMHPFNPVFTESRVFGQ